MLQLLLVIPAKAGISTPAVTTSPAEIPTFAGMTERKLAIRPR
ncbi:MAG: hypothetical protein QOH81_2648 [Sphingomonadales bacterium]|jgi:hypothetical protein|nr:hypothetical protein [Sphingomonadales bacterium]